MYSQYNRLTVNSGEGGMGLPPPPVGGESFHLQPQPPPQQVIIAQPVIEPPVVIAGLVGKPPSYLCCSIFVLLCCSPIFGCCALIFACMSESAYSPNVNDAERARSHGKTACCCSWTGIVINIITILILAGVIIYYKLIVEREYIPEFDECIGIKKIFSGKAFRCGEKEIASSAKSVATTAACLPNSGNVINCFINLPCKWNSATEICY